MDDFIKLYLNFSEEELLAESEKLQKSLMNMEEIPNLLEKIEAVNFVMQEKIDKLNGKN